MAEFRDETEIVRVADEALNTIHITRKGKIELIVESLDAACRMVGDGLKEAAVTGEDVSSYIDEISSSIRTILSNGNIVIANANTEIAEVKRIVTDALTARGYVTTDLSGSDLTAACAEGCAVVFQGQAYLRQEQAPDSQP